MFTTRTYDHIHFHYCIHYRNHLGRSAAAVAVAAVAHHIDHCRSLVGLVHRKGFSGLGSGHSHRHCRILRTEPSSPDQYFIAFKGYVKKTKGLQQLDVKVQKLKKEKRIGPEEENEHTQIREGCNLQEKKTGLAMSGEVLTAMLRRRQCQSCQRRVQTTTVDWLGATVGALCVV